MQRVEWNGESEVMNWSDILEFNHELGRAEYGNYYATKLAVCKRKITHIPVGAELNQRHHASTTTPTLGAIFTVLSDLR
jgi:hypothetical protein